MKSVDFYQESTSLILDQAETSRTKWFALKEKLAASTKKIYQLERKLARTVQQRDALYSKLDKLLQFEDLDDGPADTITDTSVNQNEHFDPEASSSLSEEFTLELNNADICICAIPCNDNDKGLDNSSISQMDGTMGNSTSTNLPSDQKFIDNDAENVQISSNEEQKLLSDSQPEPSTVQIDSQPEVSTLTVSSDSQPNPSTVPIDSQPEPSTVSTDSQLDTPEQNIDQKHSVANEENSLGTLEQDMDLKLYFENGENSLGTSEQDMDLKLYFENGENSLNTSQQDIEQKYSVENQENQRIENEIKSPECSKNSVEGPKNDFNSIPVSQSSMEVESNDDIGSKAQSDRENSSLLSQQSKKCAWECSICDRRFTRPEILAKHIMRIHGTAKSTLRCTRGIIFHTIKSMLRMNFLKKRRNRNRKPNASLTSVVDQNQPRDQEKNIESTSINHIDKTDQNDQTEMETDDTNSIEEKKAAESSTIGKCDENADSAKTTAKDEPSCPKRDGKCISVVLPVINPDSKNNFSFKTKSENFFSSLLLQPSKKLKSCDEAEIAKLGPKKKSEEIKLCTKSRKTMQKTLDSDKIVKRESKMTIKKKKSLKTKRKTSEADEITTKNLKMTLRRKKSLRYDFRNTL